MAATSQPGETTHKTVYRTVQESPALLGRIVGPTFSTKKEAKRVAERFAEEKLNATPTYWEQADDDTDAVTMTPMATRHTLRVEPVTIHESAAELTEPSMAKRD